MQMHPNKLRYWWMGFLPLQKDFDNLVNYTYLQQFPLNYFFLF
jgi:hypothetical protein